MSINIIKKKKKKMSMPVYNKINQKHLTNKIYYTSIEISTCCILCYSVRSKPGGKDHSTAFPVRYRIPIQQLPHGLKKKHEKKHTSGPAGCTTLAYMYLQSCDYPL